MIELVWRIIRRKRGIFVDGLRIEIKLFFAVFRPVLESISRLGGDNLFTLIVGRCFNLRACHDARQNVVFKSIIAQRVESNGVLCNFVLVVAAVIISVVVAVRSVASNAHQAEKNDEQNRASESENFLHISSPSEGAIICAPALL